VEGVHQDRGEKPPPAEQPQAGARPAEEVKGADSPPTDVAESLSDSAEGVLRNIAESVSDAAQAVVDGIQNAIAGSANLIEDCLEVLETDITEKQSKTEIATDIALGMAPFIGQMNDYADARLLYKQARARADQASPDTLLMLQNARRMCLGGCISLGLQIGTLGAAGAVLRGVRAVKRGYTVLGYSRMVSKVPIPGVEQATRQQVDLKSPTLDALLKIDVVENAMDMLLESVDDLKQVGKE